MPLKPFFDEALVSALFLSFPWSLGHHMLALLSDCSSLLPYFPAFPSGQFCTQPSDQLSNHSHGSVILFKLSIQGLHVETLSSWLLVWSPLCQHLLQVLDCPLQAPCTLLPRPCSIHSLHPLFTSVYIQDPAWVHPPLLPFVRLFLQSTSPSTELLEHFSEEDWHNFWSFGT